MSKSKIFNFDNHGHTIYFSNKYIITIINHSSIVAYNHSDISGPSFENYCLQYNVQYKIK